MPVPVDLCKLSNVVKNDVVKKVVYDKLVVKVNYINTGGFVLKNKYDTDKTELIKEYIMKNSFITEKIKFMILVNLLRKQITILKLLN